MECLDTTTRSWVLIGDGNKQVFVRYRDAVGNTTTPVSAYHPDTLHQAPLSPGQRCRVYNGKRLPALMPLMPPK